MLENKYLDISPEVKAALEEGKPVVALESTIISHGMPYPKNVETALEVERIVREGGTVPATIAILGGKLKVGLTRQEIDYLGKKGTEVTKASRRDIPFILATKGDGGHNGSCYHDHCGNGRRQGILHRRNRRGPSRSPGDHGYLCRP